MADRSATSQTERDALIVRQVPTFRYAYRYPGSPSDEFERLLPHGYVLWDYNVAVYQPEAAAFLASLPRSYYLYHILLGPWFFYTDWLYRKIKERAGPISLRKLYEPFASYGPYSLLHLCHAEKNAALLHDREPICRMLGQAEGFEGRANAVVGTIDPLAPTNERFDITIVGADSIRYFSLEQASEFLLRLNTKVVVLLISQDATIEGDRDFFYRYKGKLAKWQVRKRVSDEFSVMTLRYGLQVLDAYPWYTYRPRFLLERIKGQYAVILRGSGEVVLAKK